MVKFYPHVFSPFIQDKHNQTVIGMQRFRRQRSERFISHRTWFIGLRLWEIQLLEAFIPLQSPDRTTIERIMSYAKQAGTP